MSNDNIHPMEKLIQEASSDFSPVEHDEPKVLGDTKFSYTIKYTQINAPTIEVTYKSANIITAIFEFLRHVRAELVYDDADDSDFDIASVESQLTITREKS